MLKRSFERDPETNNDLIVLSMRNMTLLLCVCLVTIR